MPWGRLHDQAGGDAKLLALSDAAWRMWGCGLIYCQARLTDGFIPEYAIVTFGVRAKNKAAVIEELCQSLVPGKGPLWLRVPGGYQVHDYLDWNDSREEVEQRRESDRRRKGFRPDSDRNRRRVGVDSDRPTTTTTDVRTTGSAPPNPLDERFERFWVAYPRKVAKAAARKAWAKLDPSEAMTEIMLAAVARQCRCEQWLKERGQFIPYPATWLNQGRWDDETRPAASGRTGAADAAQYGQVMRG